MAEQQGAPKGAAEDTPAPAIVPAREPAPQAPKSVAQVVGETVVDLAAIVGTIALAMKGQAPGEFALVLVALLAGVRVNDLFAARGGNGGPPAAGGLAGLLMLAAHVGPRSHSGFVRVPRFVEHIAVGLRLAWAWAVDPPKQPRRRARRDAIVWAPLACLVALAASLALAGCPLPPPDFCTPRDTRCAPDGVPEVCSQGQRWTRGSPAEPCPSGSSCCLARSPYGGREIHACAPASACLPERPVSAPSALAETQ